MQKTGEAGELTPIRIATGSGSPTDTVPWLGCEEPGHIKLRLSPAAPGFTVDFHNRERGDRAMALPRMRWTNTGADLIRTQARDGAMVSSIDEPRSPRRTGRLHVYLHAPKPKPATRTHDAAPPARRPAMRRDQAREGSGEVLCRLGKHGTTGEWNAEDAGGVPLVIRQAGDGRYEIVRPDTGPQGPREQQRDFASLSPARDATDNNPASLRTLQTLLDRHYAK